MFKKGHKINNGRKQTLEHIANVRLAIFKPKLIKICEICKQEFQIIPSRKNRKYCNYLCQNLGKKGRTPWNKGLIDFRLGEKRPNIIPKGQDNGSWKGDKVGYRGLHIWVQNNLGKPKECEFCGLTDINCRRFHWANKSGNYLRKLNDWLRLCVKCHKAYDGYGIGEYLN